MSQKDFSNTIFELAVNLVNDTSQHLFLTGKAGTGKTTFLRHIREVTQKNTVVVAPTGVAAINAGGVTMHSFFQLPRGLFLPEPMPRTDLIGFMEVTDKHSLFRNIHFTSNKRQLLQELELLIIDEVSMMRCDMLDAIDTILRHIRKVPHQPFGGVQVLYIGDLFQLPPVVNNEEWNVLQQYYESPFFFSARVSKEAPPLYIELKKIYRQNDQEFIDVLNRIRNNVPTKQDFEFLNKKYDPAFQSPEDDHYITITTHNKKAEAINQTALQQLSGPLYNFKATIKDDFSDKAFPTDPELKLKVGAQVMFIKNDTSPERRYFNGKLATVKKILKEEITVTFDDNGEDLVLEKETWKNIRYIYNRENDDIDEEELGSFTQFPIRLAWAITIHKSQGLTFDKAVIDSGSSFAAGQVYVALSRCTSMNGLVLRSRIFPFSIATDKRIIEFSSGEIEDLNELTAILEKEKYRHWGLALVKLFDWTKLMGALYNWLQLIREKKIPDNDAAETIAKDILKITADQHQVAQKFQQQLENILRQAQETKDTTLLKERMVKAIHYFGGVLTNSVLKPVQEHKRSIQYLTRINKYREEVTALEQMIWQTVVRLVQSRYGTLLFLADNPFRNFEPMVQVHLAKSGPKSDKIPSQKISLDLFKEGKAVEEIAALRNITIGTVEGHLSPYVLTGEVDAAELVHPEKLEQIIKVIEVVGTSGLGAIKNRLGDEYSFHEVRVAVNHFRFLQKESA